VPPAPPKTDPALAYEHFLCESKEILDYKWIESKNAGVDIGLERALTEWVTKHRVAWRGQRKKAD
jgi:hypothetical protein